MKKTVATRPSLKEIHKEGLTEGQWRDFERKQVFKERRRLIGAGRIRYKTEPTPLVPCEGGRFTTVNGQSYDYAHQTKG